MKPENMKLLDLQTGKYLELGKDWLYGGAWVLVALKNDIDLYETFRYTPTEEDFVEIYDEGEGYAPSHGMNRIDLFNINEQIPELLKTICDKIGAVVYGDRYVLIKTFEYLNKEIKVGDIITAKTLTTSKDSISIKQHTNQIVCFRDNTAFEHSGYNMGFVICENLKCFGINGFWKHRPFDYEERQLEITGNLFEEYSKQLRKEENKFDELMEKLK